MPENPHYQQLGGEAALRQLVERFYLYMDTLPEAATIRALHAEDLSEAQEKLFAFLSGWLGGPPLYTETYGHPRLRMRHLPFPIDSAARDQWLLCMERALMDVTADAALRENLMTALRRTADFMRNREDPA